MKPTLLLTASMLTLTVGCAKRAALEGSLAGYTDLPTEEPLRVYGSVACPGAEESEEENVDHNDRMYLMESGELWTWRGGDSELMSGHSLSRWTYPKDDPTTAMWLAMADQKPDVGGRASFYIDNLGAGHTIGNLVLMPEHGETAYRLMYFKKPFMFGKQRLLKWKMEKVDDTLRVQPIPKRMPVGAECFTAVEEGWPEPIASTGWLHFRSPRAVKDLVSAGDMDGARALVAELGLLNMERYGTPEMQDMIQTWKMLPSDPSPAVANMLSRYEVSTVDELWQRIQSEYDALVAAGKAPARSGSEPEPAPEAAPEAEDAAPAGEAGAAPAESAETPAEGAETPAEGTETPAEGAETPAEESP